MHHWFITVHTQVFSDIRTIEKKICLNNERTKCLDKNTKRQKYGGKNFQLNK